MAVAIPHADFFSSKSHKKNHHSINVHGGVFTSYEEFWNNLVTNALGKSGKLVDRMMEFTVHFRNSECRGTEGRIQSDYPHARTSSGSS